MGSVAPVCIVGLPKRDGTALIYLIAPVLPLAQPHLLRLSCCTSHNHAAPSRLLLLNASRFKHSTYHSFYPFYFIVEIQ